MQTDLLTSVLDLTGVFANGLLGGAVARSQGLDLFGFGALGLVCGLGGGVIRDVLLQHGAPAALTHPAYIATALAGAGVAFVIRIEHRAWDRVFLLVDAAAISLWATAGALITLAAGLGWVPAVLLGTITAVGGGVSRDVTLTRVPTVFTEGPLYATVAMFVAAIQVVCVKALGPADGHHHRDRRRVRAAAGGLPARLAAAARPGMAAPPDRPARRSRRPRH